MSEGTLTLQQMEEKINAILKVEDNIIKLLDEKLAKRLVFNKDILQLLRNLVQIEKGLISQQWEQQKRIFQLFDEVIETKDTDINLLNSLITLYKKLTPLLGDKGELAEIKTKISELQSQLKDHEPSIAVLKRAIANEIKWMDEIK